MTTAATIRALAAKHGVAYDETPLDQWANKITELSGDDVAMDNIGWLLIALQRAGHLTRNEANQLHVAHLREKYG
jgi:hypothetical protein